MNVIETLHTMCIVTHYV